MPIIGALPRATLGVVAAGVLCGEYILVAQAFDIEPALQRGGIWSELVPLRQLGLFVALGAAGTGMALGHSAADDRAERRPTARRLLLGHICAYLAFLALTWLVLARSTAPSGPPVLWLAAWASCGLFSTALLLGAVLGPGIFTLRTLGACAIGACVGAIGFFVGRIAQAGWLPLAAATLVLSQIVLEVFSPM